MPNSEFFFFQCLGSLLHPYEVSKFLIEFLPIQEVHLFFKIYLHVIRLALMVFFPIAKTLNKQVLKIAETQKPKQFKKLMEYPMKLLKHKGS